MSPAWDAPAHALYLATAPEVMFAAYARQPGALAPPCHPVRAVAQPPGCTCMQAAVHLAHMRSTCVLLYPGMVCGDDRGHHAVALPPPPRRDGDCLLYNVKSPYMAL